jgi:hypothetical protein
MSDELFVGAVVEPDESLEYVQSPEGPLVSSTKLGPGIVQELGSDGKVCVRWVRAGFETWMEKQELRPYGREARLIAIMRRDKQGHVNLLGYQVDKTTGLKHNWTVEMLPDAVVRAVRHDGSAWTFDYNKLFKSVKSKWPQPPKDDDAEALAAADIAVDEVRR